MITSAEYKNDTKRKTKAIRTKMTLLLIIICLTLLSIIVTFNLILSQITLFYLCGLLFAFIGLTYRSVLFLDYVDKDKDDKILPYLKQIQIVFGTYLSIHIPKIIIYSIISVSLIILIFVKNGEPETVHYILLSAVNIACGLTVKLQKI